MTDYVLKAPRGHFLGEEFPKGTLVSAVERDDDFLDIRLPDGTVFVGSVGHDVVPLFVSREEV